MLANPAYTRNTTGRNAGQRGAGPQYRFSTVLPLSIQARILPLRSAFHPDSALVFQRNIWLFSELRESNLRDRSNCYPHYPDCFGLIFQAL
jgi:hypothetical protein